MVAYRGGIAQRVRRFSGSWCAICQSRQCCHPMSPRPRRRSQLARPAWSPLLLLFKSTSPPSASLSFLLFCLHDPHRRCCRQSLFQKKSFALAPRRSFPPLTFITSNPGFNFILSVVPVRSFVPSRRYQHQSLSIIILAWSRLYLPYCESNRRAALARSWGCAGPDVRVSAVLTIPGTA